MGSKKSSRFLRKLDFSAKELILGEATANSPQPNLYISASIEWMMLVREGNKHTIRPLYYLCIALSDWFAEFIDSLLTTGSVLRIAPPGVL